MAGDTSPIVSFFRGRSVLITGGTGFVGKALVEKLLWSCPEIGTIYLLVRPKWGQDVETRRKELLKNPVFDRVREGCPHVLDKVVTMQGDVSEVELGLSEADTCQLSQQVSVVFHSAATVRFNEPLKQAVTLNTRGTQRVLELCKKMTNLQAFIHVSTAYSNAEKTEVEEIVYPPPANPHGLMQCVESMGDDILDIVSSKLVGKHPNTYTLTKAMAEAVVAEQCGSLPVAIVRPSIVTAAWREPVPGWVDNVCGVTGIMMEIGRGTIRSIICDQRLVMDVIPVDFVVNTLITAAWHTATQRPSSIIVYNCTSGSLNPVRWEEFGKLTFKHACATPTKHIMWYPGFTFRTNRVLHKICQLLFHYLPAYIVDLLLRIRGIKPIMVKVCKRFEKAAKTGEFFALHEWKFHCSNLKKLLNEIIGSDRSRFDVDVTSLDWDQYVGNYMLGIRRFILKDTSDSIPSAKQKLRKLYWVHQVTQALTIIFLLKMARFR